jgi:putative tricarboxylic transport membrane protein
MEYPKVSVMVRRNIAYGDLLSSVALSCLATYILLEGRKWAIYGSEGPGPGFFPIMYGSVMLVLSLYLLQRSVRVGAPPRPADKAPTDPKGVVSALLTWGALALCIPLMLVLGFTAGFGLFAFVIIKFVFQQSLKTSLIAAAGIAVSLHIVFPVLLQAPLPVGMLWGF